MIPVASMDISHLTQLPECLALMIVETPSTKLIPLLLKIYKSKLPLSGDLFENCLYSEMINLKRKIL